MGACVVALALSMLKEKSVLPFVLALIAAARVFFQSRIDVAVEVLALRQQVAVLKQKTAQAALWIGSSGRSCGWLRLAGGTRW